MTSTSANPWPLEGVQSSGVLAQLESILESSHFRASRRSSAFLRYVVVQTIEGSHDKLKERTIGIEVFHREPAFDTATDCTVRVAASEVRKRIAQYYQEPGKEHELRIDLPLGTYVPAFHDVLIAQPSPALQPLEVEPVPLYPVPVMGKPARGMRIWIAAAALLVVVVGLSSFALHGLWSPANSNGADYLTPFLSGPRPTILCIGVPELKQNQPGADTPECEAALGRPPMNNALVTLAEAETLSRIQGLIEARHHTFQLQLANMATFDTLRSGPSILIAALDNQWTMRLTAHRRFYFKGSDETVGEIIDRDTNRHWVVDFSLPFSERTDDYALVSITQDETLGQPLMILAGVGPNGTMAASEFLLNEENQKTLRKLAPSNWNGRNFEVVISTTVISGVSGPPKILASHFW